MLCVPSFAGEFIFEPASYVLHKCLCALVICYCIYGCSAGTRLQSDNQDSIDEKNESLQMTFIDFKATGNEPSWVLEIDFDKRMHFKSLNHPEEIITPVPKPDIAQDIPVERYRALTEMGELIVTIVPDTCMDNMSGEKFPFFVTVDVKLSNETDYTEFKGCGRYLLDNRLHNIWGDD